MAKPTLGTNADPNNPNGVAQKQTDKPSSSLSQEPGPRGRCLHRQPGPCELSNPSPQDFFRALSPPGRKGWDRGEAGP